MTNSGDDERYVSRKDFERESEETRRKFEREREERTEDWTRFKKDLRISAGIDVSDDDRMERFRAAVKYASDKVKAITDAQAKSLLQRASFVLISIGGVIGAIVTLWPVLRNIVDVIMGTKH